MAAYTADGFKCDETDALLWRCTVYGRRRHILNTSKIIKYFSS